VSIYVGLFGADLTDFLAYCYDAYQCDYYKYSELYDGWAIGSYWAIAEDTDSLIYDEYLGLCLDDWSCFGLYLNTYKDADDIYHYYGNAYSYVLRTEPSETNPYATFAGEWARLANEYYLYFRYGFDNGYFYTTTNYDGNDDWPTGQTWYRFQNTYLPKYEIGDTMTVWAIYSQDEGANVSTDVELDGSLALAGSIAIALSAAALL